MCLILKATSVQLGTIGGIIHHIWIFLDESLRADKAPEATPGLFRCGNRKAPLHRKQSAPIGVHVYTAKDHAAKRGLDRDSRAIILVDRAADPAARVPGCAACPLRPRADHGDGLCRLRTPAELGLDPDAGFRRER